MEGGREGSEEKLRARLRKDREEVWRSGRDEREW